MPKESNRREIGHLLRRAGFGPSEAELRAYEPLGFERAVERLVSGLASPAPGH